MATATGTIITMTDTAALLRLMSFLSPVFPTGGFAHSAGLEQAAADGMVFDTRTLASWVETQLAHGSAWNDAVFLVAAMQAANDRDALDILSDEARALVSASERLAEMTRQGTSFLDAAAHWFEQGALPRRGTPLCVAFGAAAGLSGITREPAAGAFLHAFAINQLQVAIRLSVTGQNGAAAILAQLEPVIAETAARAAHSTLNDLGTCAFLADIAAMNHETLQPRLFLS